MSYIGSTPTTQSFIAGTDYFNGDGSTVAFTLSRSVVSVNDIEVVINNVDQQPNTAYTVSGTTITFTSAPSAGTGNIYVRYLSTTTQSITPSQNTVSYSTLNSDNQSKLGISFKNRIINGACVIDQRSAGASTTPTTSGYYSCDRWYSELGAASKFSIQQNAGSVTPPAGFTNYIGITSLSAYSLSAGDYFYLTQNIEGYNTADIGWGTSNSQLVTVSFWVRSSLTGTFSVSFECSGNNQSYAATYTINAANTWQYVTITIPSTASGTWNTTNNIGVKARWNLGTGATLSGTANTWSSGRTLAATGATSVVGTSGATFYITGVQLEVGTQATTFDYRSYGTELALCQRYFEKSYDQGTVPASAVSAGGSFYGGSSGATTTAYLGMIAVTHLVVKRATPTLVIYDFAGASSALLRFQLAVSSVNGQPASTSDVGTRGFSVYSASGSNTSGIACQWTSSAEL